MKASEPIITSAQLAAHRAGLPVPITEKIAAVLTGRSVKRLQNDRWKDRGIPSIKDGKSVRYLLADCLAAVERNRRA